MQTSSGGPIKRQKDGYRYIPNENGGWSRISDNEMSDVFATAEFTPNKTKTGSSITRTQQPKTSNYRSAYNPDDVVKGFNALTLGGLNNLSPTQWVRRAYDTGKLLTGNMTWSGYTDSWINGNNGLVSQKFSEEHPYISTGINLVGDAATLGGISGAKKLTNISKPNVNVTANIETIAKQGTNTLSQEELQKAFETARKWHLNRINSPGYKDRALRAGFTEKEIPQLQQQLTDQINRLKLQRPEEVLGSNIKLNHNSNGKPSAGYWKTNINGDLKQGISLYDSNMSYDDAVSNFIHEFGHGATFGLNGTETSGYMKTLSDQFPLINRAVKYNRSLYPEITVERVEQAAPGAIRTGNVGYFASPTEMQSRGYEFMRDYGSNWVKAYKSGELPSKTHQDLVGSRVNSNIFNTIATPKGAANFQKNALGISVPLGLGGYGLYNNDNQQQQLQYQKQGGKMNILEFLKNGSGIHIKEKNRGKFTSYCGGKVTNECIQRGKNSSNPAIRKRATFADNARHFKHRSGGKIDFYNLGGWFKNTFNNVSSFLGSDTGKSVLSIGSGLLGLGKSISNSGKIADAANEAEEAVDAQESADRQKSFTEKYAAILQEKLSKPDIDVNGSPIHTNGVNVTNEAYNQAVNTFNFDNSKYNQMRKYIKEQAQQVQNENSSSMIGSVGGLIDSIGGIAGSFWNKSTTPKTSQVITGNPNSSKQVITTNSGMSGTVDDWRKAILG